MRIVILEDNIDRQQSMLAALADRLPSCKVELHSNVAAFLESLQRGGLFDVELISLDHDLEILVAPDGQRRDPGTGIEAVDWLSKQPALAPVVVHTTNTSAGDRMVEMLLRCGWNCDRVTPYGGMDWIEETWLPLVRKNIVACSPNRGMASMGLKIISSSWRASRSVETVISRLIQAAKHLIDSVGDEAVSIQLLYLDGKTTLSPLLPESGVLDSMWLSMLNFELEGNSLDVGSRKIDNSSFSSEFKRELKARQCREIQFDVLRLASPDDMHAFLVTASRSERVSLGAHRVQSVLRELTGLLEIALTHELRTGPILTRRKAKR